MKQNTNNSILTFAVLLRGISIETIPAPFTAVSLGVANATQALSSPGVTASGHTGIDVAVALTGSAGAAGLVRVSIVTFVASGAVGAFVADGARALNLEG